MHEPVLGLSGAVAEVAFEHWPYPRLIAHRGAGKRAPENTLAALRLGAFYGYRMFEFDVTLSADGRPVLLHDSTLDRTTNGQGPVACATWTELSLLDAGSWHSAAFAGEPIPHLMLVAAWLGANGLAANIEIKPSPGRERETGAVVASVAAYAWRRAGAARVPPLLSSFSEEALAGAQQAAPDLPRALLVEDIKDDVIVRLKSLACVALVGREAALTAQHVQNFQAHHYRVLTYTVNDPDRVATMQSWGVDGVITDAVDLITPSR
jgi:glycerophosphoryl diester phosphodiesterase